MHVCASIFLSVNECNGSAKVSTSNNGSYVIALAYLHWMHIHKQDVTMLTWELTGLLQTVEVC